MSDDVGKVPEEHTDSAERKLSGLKPFKPGEEWTGNAKGRPKGSRNKLSEEFLSDLLVEWRENGPTALKAAALEKPVEFCKMVANLLPKQIQIKDELSDFTDEQLAALNALVASLIGNTEGAESEDSQGTGQKTLQ